MMLSCVQDGSENESLEDEVLIDTQSTDSKFVPSGTTRRLASEEWEILEGLRNGKQCEQKPSKFSGYIMKSRKGPMKGWHKVLVARSKMSHIVVTAISAIPRPLSHIH